MSVACCVLRVARWKGSELNDSFRYPIDRSIDRSNSALGRSNESRFAIPFVLIFRI